MEAHRPQIHPVVPSRRGGFTLIELLVVVSIIALLASLLLAAVTKARATAQMVNNRNNITEVEAAINNFKQAFQVDYLPSSIAPGDPFLSLMYPGAPPAAWNAMGTKQGSQCLIFFLGGVDAQGFSSNPQAPLTPLVTGEHRKGPFMEFKKIPSTRFTNGCLCDVYGTPFAYFSATGAPNSYTPGPDPAGSGCAGPYLEANGTTYLKPDTFQLISAGPNLQFNSGNRWPGASGVGADDMSNFATGFLGAGQ